MYSSRFLHPYYVLNFVLCLCYVLLRVQRLRPGELAMADMFGITREWNIYICLILILVTRMLSAPTLDVYLASAFMFSRVAIVLCLWYMDERMLVVFIALWTLVYALCPQPRYRLPSTISVLNNVTFQQRVINNKYDKYHVVWCHAAWSARCNQLLPIFPKLAKKYGHVRILFSTLDVSRSVNVAQKLKVNTSPASKQLPTVILFKHGQEVARIPIADESGNIAKEWTRGFTDRHVADRLDLPTHLQQAKKWEKAAQLSHQQKKKN